MLAGGSDHPMIAKPVFRSAKRMFYIFFDERGPLPQILVPKGRTVTGNFYTDNCLLQVELDYAQTKDEQMA